MSVAAWQLPNADRILDRACSLPVSNAADMHRTVAKIEKVLSSFRIAADVVEIHEGPRETLFTLERQTFGRYGAHSHTLSVSILQRRAADLAFALAAADISIRPADSGREAVVLGIPLSDPRPVTLAEVVTSAAFGRMSASLKLALGLDASGTPMVIDLHAMPHMLIGGTPGSGKSICMHAFIVSLLLGNSPDNARLLMIDSKMVELGLYDGIPHLVMPVITELPKLTTALEWLRAEATRRLEQFRRSEVRDLREYNHRAASSEAPRLPFIVALIDDVGEVLARSQRAVAEMLVGVAAAGRTTGIHLIVSTSRPSDTLVARVFDKLKQGHLAGF